VNSIATVFVVLNSTPILEAQSAAMFIALCACCWTFLRFLPRTIIAKSSAKALHSLTGVLF
jgi:hypothetical protein